MKIYTDITIIIRIMQKLFMRDIQGKEWMRGRGWRGRCNMVSTGWECYLPWLNGRYLFASNAGSGSIAAGITKFTSYTSSHGTEIFPPPWNGAKNSLPLLEKWDAAIWQNFQAFWRINVGRKLSLFLPAKRKLGWQMRFIFCLDWKLVVSVN